MKRINKHLCILAGINLIVVVLSYLLAFNINSSKIESAIYNLYHYSLTNNQYQFVHSEFGDEEGIEYTEINKLIIKTNRIDTQRYFLQPYAVFSEGRDPLKFEIECKKDDDNPILSYQTFVGIYTYHDVKIMENIALPLYDKTGTRNISKGKEDALFGCYIPYSFAISLMDYYDLSDVDELITKNHFINVLSEGLNFKISINNIYFDIFPDNYSHDEYDKKFTKYNRFYNVFYGGSIIVDTHSFSRICRKTIFCCDFVKGVGRTKALINNIVGSDFHSSNWVVEFKLNKDNRFLYAFNEYCVHEKYYSIFAYYFFLVMLVITILVYCVLLLFFRLKKKILTRNYLSLIIVSVGIPFCLLSPSYVVSQFNFSFLYFTTSFFTPFGNSLMLIFTFINIGLLLFFYLFDRTRKKQ